MMEEEEELADDQEVPEDEDLEEETKPCKKRPAAKKPGNKAAKAPKAKAKRAAKAKAKAKAKKNENKGRGTGRGRGRGRGGGKPNKEEAADKAKLSRKSAAYHKAKKEALEAGMTLEEAGGIARDVTNLHGCISYRAMLCAGGLFAWHTST